MNRFPVVLLGLVGLASAIAPRGSVDTLPLPVLHPYSFELLANSRYSTHSGFDDSLPRQVLANVLWAMDRALHRGTDGQDAELYVATRENVYRYDAASRGLLLHVAGDQRYNSGSAFEVGIATRRNEEAGIAMQAGLLAATAFRAGPREPRDAGTTGVVSCPMKWAADNANVSWRPVRPVQMVVVLGAAEVEPLDTSCVARSSDTSLPRPHAVGADTFENVLQEFGEATEFRSFPLSIETEAQLLWAAYGVTPHMTYNGRQGLTVPTASANYELTGRIYVVDDRGVERYESRTAPALALTSRDHRLQRVTSGDRRPLLRSASERIPTTAPLYVVVCVADTGAYQVLQEAGAAGFQLQAQARALGLAGRLVLPLKRSEREAVVSALGLPKGDAPVLVFACGEAVEKGLAADETDQGDVKIVRGEPAIRQGKMELEYLLQRSGPVRVEVFDMLGRSVRLLLDEDQSAGLHTASWDGTAEDGRRLKRGTYLVAVFSHGSVARHKVSLG